MEKINFKIDETIKGYKLVRLHQVADTLITSFGSSVIAGVTVGGFTHVVANNPIKTVSASVTAAVGGFCIGLGVNKTNNKTTREKIKELKRLKNTALPYAMNIDDFMSKHSEAYEALENNHNKSTLNIIGLLSSGTAVGLYATSMNSSDIAEIITKSSIALLLGFTSLRICCDRLNGKKTIEEMNNKRKTKKRLK